MVGAGASVVGAPVAEGEALVLGAVVRTEVVVSLACDVRVFSTPATVFRSSSVPWLAVRPITMMTTSPSAAQNHHREVSFFLAGGEGGICGGPWGVGGSSQGGP